MAVGTAVALLVAAACGGDDGGDDDGGEDGAGGTGGLEATIVRTEGGIPHITGDSIADVVFGQGYASAEDRACDLADQVVKVRGERARWFGPGEDGANIDSDVAWRTIGILDRATEDWESASDEVTEVIEAYTAGWNAHLDEVGVDGLGGWCAGAEWVRPLEPVEIYAYGRSIALLASSEAIVDYIGTARPPGSGDGGSDDGSGDDGAGGSGDGGSDDGGGGAGGSGGDEAAFVPPAEDLGSNGWAVGSERTADGTGMLVANPHFPWEGERRFWEVHLTVPGELDGYGVQLSGLPGIGIGFNDDVGWTHTVSAGHRFTAYRLDLVDGDPTSYNYGDEVREMTSEDLTIEVQREGGEVDQVDRTVWSTHYGPVLDFPGFGWTEEATLSYRDANIGNDALFRQYLEMIQAGSLDELIEVHERVGGVPLFNTVAVSSEGRAWYADTSATPNLSDEALADYRESLENDPIVGIARDNRAILLDGSDPGNEWVEAEGARSPGLVPFEDMPQIERDDYVFNANDSFWMPHATARIEGDHSLLHGSQDTVRTPRTRENATVLADTSPDGPAGEDGRFTLDELAGAALQNRGYTSRVLLEAVVGRCEEAGTVSVPEAPGDDGGDGAPGLPAGDVDVSEACRVLAEWDGVYDLDRSGPAVWREMLHVAGMESLLDEGEAAGSLWAEPFDPERPLDTPGGLAPAPEQGPDPVLRWLARAVQTLDAAGYPVDVTLGEIQFAPRAGETVPIHGGDSYDGVTNIVGGGEVDDIQDPALDVEREPVTADSPLTSVGDRTGYRVNNGTSFLMALELGEDGPEARTFLTYGNTEDRDDPAFVEATRRFSEKEWRSVLLDPDEIEEAAVETTTVGG